MAAMSALPPSVSSRGGTEVIDSHRVIQGRFKLGKLLGAGNFAKVYLAHDLKTNAQVAIKVMDKEMIYKNKLAVHILREIVVMKRVRHRHVVRLYEVMATKSKVYLVMELIRGGELFHRVKKGRLVEDEARRYFQQLISAVAFCHAQGVFHRDLKPENILIDDHGDIKVSDFGLSALIEGQRGSEINNVLQTFVGTPAYIAPEVLKRQGYDGDKVDIWSCGIILFVLMAGYLPFNDKNLGRLYRKIYQGSFRCPIWFSSDLIQLLRGILNTDPDKRMTIVQIMDSSWFKKDYQRVEMSEEDDEEEDDGDDEESGYDSDTSVFPCPANLLRNQQQQLLKIPTLNAFDIISFSSGFDLSGLFGETGEETRFLARKSAEDIISKLKDIAKVVSFRVRKKNTMLTLDGRREGIRRPLTITVQIFELTSILSILLVNKKSGDKSAYDDFLNAYMKPRLGNLMESPLVRTPQRIGKTPSPAPRQLPKMTPSQQLIRSSPLPAPSPAPKHRHRISPGCRFSPAFNLS